MTIERRYRSWPFYVRSDDEVADWVAVGPGCVMRDAVRLCYGESSKVPVYLYASLRRRLAGAGCQPCGWHGLSTYRYQRKDVAEAYRRIRDSEDGRLQEKERAATGLSSVEMCGVKLETIDGVDVARIDGDPKPGMTSLQIAAGAQRHHRNVIRTWRKLSDSGHVNNPLKFEQVIQRQTGPIAREVWVGGSRDVIRVMMEMSSRRNPSDPVAKLKNRFAALVDDAARSGIEAAAAGDIRREMAEHRAETRMVIGLVQQQVAQMGEAVQAVKLLAERLDQ